MSVDTHCQMAWLAAAMSLAGATLVAHDACAARPCFRIAMRLSRLGFAAAFDVVVCADHHRELCISPYYVQSDRLPDGTCGTR